MLEASTSNRTNIRSRRTLSTQCSFNLEDDILLRRGESVTSQNVSDCKNVDFKKFRVLLLCSENIKDYRPVISPRIPSNKILVHLFS